MMANNNNPESKKLSIAQARGDVYAAALDIAECANVRHLEPLDVEEAFYLASEILKLKPKYFYILSKS